MRAWRVSPLTVLGLLTLMWSHSALAQERTDARPIRRLNVAPFYMGVRDKTELIQVINRYADDIRTGLSMAGVGQLADAVIGEIRDGRLDEASLPVGQTFEFMLFRHTMSGRDRDTGRQFSRGEVDVVRNLYWAGKSPIQAYVLRVEDQQYKYTFAIPFGTRGCSNLALIEKKPFPVCVLRVSKAEGACWTIDASASYSTEDITSVQVTVSDASGNVLVTQDGRSAFQWCCPAPTGTYTVRVEVTNREGIKRDCSEVINCGVPVEGPNTQPRCVLVVSPESALSGQTVTIDATGASDAENCIQSNVVEIKDGSGNVLLSANGNEVIFYKFKSGGTFTITNTVTDCKGATSVCEKTVTVTRKRFHFLLALGGMFEKKIGAVEHDEFFDIALVVQTDPWPDRQFIRATIQQLSAPTGIGTINYRIQGFRDGAQIADSPTATIELQMQGPGNYRFVGTAQSTFAGRQLEDTESVEFTLSNGANSSFSGDDNSDTVTTTRDEKQDNWYIPIKAGFAYELVSNLEAAIYGGVAISVDNLDDSALFGDLELNYRGDPIMFGVGLGWWNFNHSEADNVDLLINAGIIFAKSLFGSDTWTFLVQGRFPLDTPEGTSFGDEYRIFFGIRLDF